MIKLTINEVSGFKYKLSDENNKNYVLHLQFYGLKNDLNVNDSIYINENLLQEINNIFACFGSGEEKFGKEVKEENKKDFICLLKDNERIYLKRFYG